MTDQVPNLSADQVAAILAAELGPALPCEPVPVINGLQLRRALGREEWGVPQENGCCGWIIDGLANGRHSRVIVTGDHLSDQVNGNNWIHASISHRDSMPGYEAMKLLHNAVFGDRWAYQVFAPGAAHINIHAYALHLFGRVDGEPALPDFGRFGTI